MCAEPGAGSAEPGQPVIALDIGGTKIAGAVLDLATLDTHGAGETTVLRQTPTPAQRGGPTVLRHVVSLAGQLANEARERGDEPGSIAVASAGVVDPATGAITHATRLLPGWAGTALAAELTQHTGLPCTVLNDVHAHGVGEASLGAGRGARRVLVVTVGTGLGAALVDDGVPQQGSHGVAGHLGHVCVPEAAGLRCSCGRQGHVEAVASGSGVAAAYARRVGLPDDAAGVDAAEVSRRAGTGEPAAIEVLATAGRALGRAIGMALNVCDPDRVVIGGSLCRAPQPWWDGIEAGVEHEAMDAVVHTQRVRSQLGPEAALWGAAIYAARGTAAQRHWPPAQASLLGAPVHRSQDS
ncbi:MAG: ROK family protein [Micrococcus sp.]|nr:ROK family protein [Micrococcus sp.]